MQHAFVLLSGGMDSAAVLARAVHVHGHRNVQAVNIRYGSKHNPYEMECAEKLCDYYEVARLVVPIDFQAFASSPLLANNANAIPEGHYEAKTMKATVVPGRNLIFAAIAASVAESYCNLQKTAAAAFLYLGVHAGDHAIYPDCRAPFVFSLENTIKLSTDGKVFVEAPYLAMNKADILLEGNQWVKPVPWQMTRTCYKSQPVACGKCGSCQERLEAFQKIGKQDPIEYESRQILPK